MKTYRILTLIIALITTTIASAQYCEPVHGAQWFAPIIQSVELEDISNLNSTNPQTERGYSDFTEIQTNLTAGSTYDIVITGGDFFPHNYAAWIDYNHDFEFSESEKIGLQTLGEAIGTWSFTVPADALNGPTRLRVRAMAEPFGPWSNSHHPCAPVGEGEAEDYTVVIDGGAEIDGALVALTPKNAPNLGVESVAVSIVNRGITLIEGATVELLVNGSSQGVEDVSGSIEPGASADHVFNTTIDLTGLTCLDLEVQLTIAGDIISSNDILTKQVCDLEPNNGTDVWYVHSNQFYPIETFDEGTTNETTMNTVFGEEEWEMAYFETLDLDQVFSTNTCVIFIDGSYTDIDPMIEFLDANGQQIEDWVAAGGHLFMNSSPESMNFDDVIVKDWGFDGVQLVQGYDIGFAIATGEHPIHTGPFQPAGSEWSAFNYSEAVLHGPGLEHIIIDNDDEFFLGPELNLPLLAEKEWGSGTVLFGVVGVSQFFDEPTSSMNSRANILEYLHECDISTSIEENSIESRISIYPNPSNSNFNIKSESSPITEISMTNTLGQVVLLRKVNAMLNVKLNASELRNGTYVISTKLANGEVFKQLAIKSE